jgi:hypothetical protein
MKLGRWKMIIPFRKPYSTNRGIQYTKKTL